MNGVTQFIHHSNTNDVLKALNNFIIPELDDGSRNILLLAGQPKTGKSRLVKHWIENLNTDTTGFIPSQQIRVLQVNTLREPLRKRAARDCYATPMACILFSEIAFALGETSIRINPTYADRTWYRKPQSLHTDTQFNSLFSFVRSEFNRLRVRILVINQAQMLDKCSLECLLQLREHCNNILGIVLVVRQQKNALLDEPLSEEFRFLPSAAAICTRVELKSLSKDEFLNIVMHSLVVELQVAFDDKLFEYEELIADLFWAQVGPDWELIQNKLARPLDRVLGKRTGQKRLLTLELLEEVFGTVFSR